MILPTKPAQAPFGPVRSAGKPRARHIIADEKDGFVVDGATLDKPTYTITCLNGATTLDVKSPDGSTHISLASGDTLQLTLKVEFNL